MMIDPAKSPARVRPRLGFRPAVGVILCLSLLPVGATASGAPAMDPAEREEVEAAVGAAVESFRSAQLARDVDAIRDHLWPEFHMLQDGQRMRYDEVAARIEATMGSLAAFRTEWNDLVVEALAPTLALASFTFSDSITMGTGEELGLTGETTLLWERRSGVWKILYADSDHYPPPSP